MPASPSGCEKTRRGEGCAEFFSQLPSSVRSCEYKRLPHRRNRDESSTSKLGIGVFTQPGSNSEVGLHNRHVRFPPVCDQTADIAGGPFRANNRRSFRRIERVILVDCSQENGL